MKFRGKLKKLDACSHQELVEEVERLREQIAILKPLSGYEIGGMDTFIFRNSEGRKHETTCDQLFKDLDKIEDLTTANKKLNTTIKLLTSEVGNLTMQLKLSESAKKIVQEEKTKVQVESEKLTQQLEESENEDALNLVAWIDDAIKQALHGLKCECPVNDGLIGGIEATNNGIRCTRCGRYKYGEVSHE